MFDFYCFPGQCHFFLLWTTNCSHHICQLQQQLFAAAWHAPNWWALSELPVSNMEQGWSASVHQAVWRLGGPAAEPGRWNPETCDPENDRTHSWNPHRYHLLAPSGMLSFILFTFLWEAFLLIPATKVKILTIQTNKKITNNTTPRFQEWPKIGIFTLSLKNQHFSLIRKKTTMVNSELAKLCQVF